MRTLYLGLAVLLTLPLAPSVFAQAGPEARSKAEYDAYVALYNAAEPEAKSRLGEAFIRDYPDSEFLALAFMNLVRAYETEGDWEQVIGTANRFQAMVPNPDQAARAFVYPYALMAAQNRNDVAGIIQFGRLLLEVAPNNLGAMLTLSSVYMENLPTNEPTRGRALAEAYDLANRARVQVQQVYAADSAARTQVEITVHTTLARVHYARTDYQRAADEYLQVVGLAPADSDAYYRLGDCYQFLAADASREVETTLAAQAEAREQGRDEATLEQLDARYEALQANVLAYLDRSIDFFATATAIGGAIGPQARQRLETLYRNRYEDSLDGLDDLVAEKRASLRAL
jgi:lipopolysaccharide biosynthesis regulator YciM